MGRFERHGGISLRINDISDRFSTNHATLSRPGVHPLKSIHAPRTTSRDWRR
jgi:hypothetical protein